jgi:hypothetical protein
MNNLLKYFKNLLTSFLIWIKPPKIGQIQIEVPPTPLDQNVRVNQDALEVNMEEWEDTFKAVFETDNFVTEGISRGTRPSDEVLKRQVQMFFKDYSSKIKKSDQLYTKLLKYQDEDEK